LLSAAAAMISGLRLIAAAREDALFISWFPDFRAGKAML
jgi:hypothetical protein